jgi:hypothetical protein
MAAKIRQRLGREVWRLAARQHGVVARWQLVRLGASDAWIKHRVANGRLHPVTFGVYAVGRPSLTRPGWLMAAVLRAGLGAFLSHESAAELWGIRPTRPGPVEVSTTARGTRRAAGLRIHRRSALRPQDVTMHDEIPVASPALTIVDLAARLSADQLERVINEADKLDRITPEGLRIELEEMPRLPGTRRLRQVLDRHTLLLTDSELERRFMPIARGAGLPAPLTQQWLSGFRVDFFWPHLGLVVETDGLRYHRTPAQQARDRHRDQALTAAGLSTLRFTHAQVRHEPAQVERTLAAVAARLARGAA